MEAGDKGGVTCCEDKRDEREEGFFAVLLSDFPGSGETTCSRRSEGGDQGPDIRGLGKADSGIAWKGVVSAAGFLELCL